MRIIIICRIYYMKPATYHWIQFFKAHQAATVQHFIVLLFAMIFSFSKLSTASTIDDTSQLRQLSQLAEYIGVDYISAIEQGQVINDDEYQEMLEFSQIIVEKSKDNLTISKSVKKIYRQAITLQNTIKNKKNADVVRKLTTELRHSLLALMPESPLPERLLSKQAIHTLYQNNCAGCHGVSGQGNGELAANLSPQPTDFTDLTRANNRSILGLFDAISNGLDDTAMPAFTLLKEQQRWSLAFYVGSLAFQKSPDIPQKTLINSSSFSLQKWVNYSPSQLKSELENADDVKGEIDGLRAVPQLLFDQQQTPISITKKQLVAAHLSYTQGDYNTAKTLIVSAYLDGFELIENSLDAHDIYLRKNIESNLIKLRSLFSRNENEEEVNTIISITLTQLGDARQLLVDQALSDGTLFVASLLILLREGIEALLVIIALMMVLLRTNRQDALKYVHIGWVLALIGGIATWAVAQSLITFSGASREIMEGVAALLAALMLLYVGIWMHSKTNAAQWQAYIQKHVDTHLKSGTLWGLTLLSFVAVYREVFETVLFYQSLLTQAARVQNTMVIGGFLLGVILLAILAWSLLKYSIKLPIARFFSTTTYLLLALAFILMGKAVSALQEAAIISISPLPIEFEIDWIGVGSTWQGVSAQLAILLFFYIYMYKSRRNVIKH